MIIDELTRHPLEAVVLAALAEAGYPDARASIMPPGSTSVFVGSGWDAGEDLAAPSHPVHWETPITTGYATAVGAPIPVIWRAFTTAGLNWVKCWRCFEVDLAVLFHSPYPWQAPCRAVGAGLTDCGRDWSQDA